MSIVNLTETAKEHMATMLKEHDKPAIRLGLKGGGCAGFKYEWSLEDEIKSDDEQIKVDGGLFVVDPASVMYLLGTTIDYKKEVFGSYFDIKSPNATSSCGCGESVGF
jgi:iron-sulfur cluster assembly accessory protein|tara:strand:+ start:1465 stop:1788 length:324 start_codon:yes stop_codon:yes gene_type:complete